MPANIVTVAVDNRTLHTASIHCPGAFRSSKQEVEPKSKGKVSIRPTISLVDRAFGKGSRYFFLKIYSGSGRKERKAHTTLRINCEGRILELVEAPEYVIEVVKHINAPEGVNIEIAVHNSSDFFVSMSRGLNISEVIDGAALSTCSEPGGCIVDRIRSWTASTTISQSFSDGENSARSQGSINLHPQSVCELSPTVRSVSLRSPSHSSQSCDRYACRPEDLKTWPSRSPKYSDRSASVGSKRSQGSTSSSGALEFSSLGRPYRRNQVDKILHRDEILQQIGAGLGGSNPFVTSPQRLRAQGPSESPMDSSIERKLLAQRRTVHSVDRSV
mmetsp:Transcript_4142/g.8505  ORF Transcript_4142/g.8505 Transcript_4142/m.8505 type:complete len:330 (-) Transcript_4142:410-1399(-)